jgi:hypothetical protein
MCKEINKGGGPAFPTTKDYGKGFDTTFESPGISIRDYFAAKIMQGFCANPAVFAENPVNGWSLVNSTPMGLAEYALTLADAMMIQRGEK